MNSPIKPIDGDTLTFEPKTEPRSAPRVFSVQPGEPGVVPDGTYAAVRSGYKTYVFANKQGQPDYLIEHHMGIRGTVKTSVTFKDNVPTFTSDDMGM